MGSEAEIRAAGRVVGDALAGAVGVVRDTHRAVAGRVFAAVGPVGQPVRVVHGLISEGVYATVRGAHAVLPRMIGVAVGYGWRPERAPLSGHRSGRFTLAVLNGLWGDTLDARHPELATPMTVRSGDEDIAPTTEALRVAFPAASPHLAVFVHGLCETEEYWSLGARPTLGSRLERELGCTAVDLRYNSGLHVSDNGLALAALLEELVASWPVPVEQLTLVGHSMGGLVIRSAGRQGAAAGHRWVPAVRHVVCLGTPHLGAPLARGVHSAAWLLARFPESRPVARLLGGRSAGVHDLGYGALVEEDWRDADPEALPSDCCTEEPVLPHADHYFVGATVTREHDNPLATVLGDLIVPYRSAVGAGHPHRLPPGTATDRHLGGLHHFDLLNHPAVHEELCALLAATEPAP
ncbi:esterase/lipase family protein [Nucisporomicrobium flavum]|uniref:esterase/lipase family protein n=1 Tax=Nucisporomicrobium flavum TaxID=2785915 RepID=UPI0018F76800|nr:alpha/beta fold hydrolase [Nucisporomicrobium flavum]